MSLPSFPELARCCSATLAGGALICGAAAAAPISDAEADALARSILASMTLEEKVSLCAGNSTMTLNAIPRVGIDAEFTMSDGPHNVRPDLARENFDSARRTDDHSTALPTLTALAATWDPALATRFGHVLGQEARARGKDMLLGPGVNIQRTPLNGRNYEYMGEDPFLAASMVVPYIRALQANDVAACIKHYALNNQEWNRGQTNVEVDDRALHEIYLPAFRAAVVEGGVLTAMNGYNRVRGEHCSHSDFLNNRLLKQAWGFPGFVVTDWGGVHDTLAGARGGLDVEMNAGAQIRFFKGPLLAAVKSGELPESLIDDKARRVLFVMAKVRHIGPGKAGRTRGAVNTPEHAAVARDVAQTAIVLLKNDAGVLPLDLAGLKSLLVVGDNAVNRHTSGGWSAEGKPLHEITPLDGLRERLGEGVRISYLPYPAEGDPTPIGDTHLQSVDPTATDSGMTIKAWAVSYFGNEQLAGTPVATGYDRYLKFEWKGAAPRPGVPTENFSARWTATVRAPESGAYALTVKADDGARVWVDEELVIDAWNGGSLRSVSGEAKLVAGRDYAVRVEYRQGTRGAAISLGWTPPSRRGAAIEAILEQARAADAVIVFTGTEHGHGQAKECEGADLPHMGLPGVHNNVIAALLALQPRTVVVNHSGTPLEFPWVGEAATLVQYWYSGQEGGRALASVLTGDVNPSGKLPFTMPVRLSDSPAHALGNYGPDTVIYAEGVFVGYRWFEGRRIAPMFPFGHGLSYTTFALGAPRVAPATARQGVAPEPEGSARERAAHGEEGGVVRLAGGDVARVGVRLRNTGGRAGAEVVQLYVAPPEGDVPRPPQELKGFAKITLEAGDEGEAVFELSARDFAHWDIATGSWKAEAGTYRARIGVSSAKIIGEVEIALGETVFFPDGVEGR